MIVYSPGTFIGRQLPPESEGAEITELVRSLLDDMSPDGFLSFVDVDDSGGYEVRMIPTTLDSRGLPVIASGEPLDRIATRIIDWSAKLGTEVELLDGELRVV
jgi:poly-gamma-glutamate capsule biosynthesis protein CapA/YwtB (metallophosphatase superfamily)